MIYLAKILPVFLLPPGLVILLVLASIVWRKRVFAIAGLLILWLSSTPVVGNLAMRAAEGWQARIPVASMPQARAIVVLTGMLTQAPGVEHVDEWGEGVDRFEAGVALWRAGKAPALIFPGGWVPWRPDAPPEGKVLADRAAALGVPRDRIVVTGKASNTAGEAREVASVLRSFGQDGQRETVILVTSAFHVRRSRLIFEQAGVHVVPFPVDFQVPEAPFTFIDLLPRADSVEKTETAMRELYGYLFYRMNQNK